MSSAALQDVPEKVAFRVEVKEVGEQLTIGPEGSDEPQRFLILNITEDTVLEEKDGSVLDISDIHVGDIVYAEFSPVMTRSIPPQSNAIKLTVLETAAITIEENRYCGVVSKLEGNTLHMDGEGYNAALLIHVSEDTVIVDKTGETLALSDVKAGACIQALTSPAYTASLPPQTTALSIMILSRR